MAKYLLAPFSHALVTEDELSLVTGEKTEMGVYTTILRILYFPIGCIAVILAALTVVGDFITLLGIPSALVWGRMLPSVFNPFNKVCVPKDVADEIERMHSAQTVGRYSGVSAQTSVVAAPSSAVAAPSSVGQYSAERTNAAVPRSFSDEKLKEITDAPELYNADLVQQCRHEMEIRCNSVGLMPQVRDFSDEKINEILADPVTYSEELGYCCSLEKAEREAKAREAARLKAEEERIRREEEERIEYERRMAWWKKWWWAVVLGVVAIISALCVGGYIQTKKEQERIAEMRRIERERFVADSIEQVRVAQEQARIAQEQARLEKERAERAKREREEQARIRKEAEEQARAEKERVERERFVADSIERSRVAQEQARIAQERAQAERERQEKLKKAQAEAEKEKRAAQNKIADFIRAHGGEVTFKTSGTAISKNKGYTTFVIRLLDSSHISVGVVGNTGSTTFRNPVLKMEVDGYWLWEYGSGYKSFTLNFAFSGDDVRIHADYQVNAGYTYSGSVTLPAR